MMLNKNQSSSFFTWLVQDCAQFFIIWLRVVQWNKGDVIVQRFCEWVYHQKEAFGSVWTVLVSI
jgi:hypothetical protein